MLCCDNKRKQELLRSLGSSFILPRIYSRCVSFGDTAYYILVLDHLSWCFGGYRLLLNGSLVRPRNSHLYRTSIFPVLCTSYPVLNAYSKLYRHFSMPVVTIKIGSLFSFKEIAHRQTPCIVWSIMQVMQSPVRPPDLPNQERLGHKHRRPDIILLFPLPQYLIWPANSSLTLITILLHSAPTIAPLASSIVSDHYFVSSNNHLCIFNDRHFTVYAIVTLHRQRSSFYSICNRHFTSSTAITFMIYNRYFTSLTIVISWCWRSSLISYTIVIYIVDNRHFTWYTIVTYIICNRYLYVTQSSPLSLVTVTFPIINRQIGGIFIDLSQNDDTYSISIFNIILILDITVLPSLAFNHVLWSRSLDQIYPTRLYISSFDLDSHLL